MKAVMILIAANLMFAVKTTLRRHHHYLLLPRVYSYSFFTKVKTTHRSRRIKINEGRKFNGRTAIMSLSSIPASSVTKNVDESSSAPLEKNSNDNDWYKDIDDGSNDIDIIPKEDDNEQQVIKDRRRSNKSFVSYPFDYHEEVEIRIEALTNRGWGLGRIDVTHKGERPPNPTSTHRSRRRKQKETDNEADDDDNSSEMAHLDSTAKKWVIMTPNVIPGELVRVRIFRNQRNYSEADVVEIIEPNVENRIEPKCPYSSECGGCQYQHMTIQAQRKWKQKSVQETLHRNNILDVTVSPPLCTDHIYEYRSKLTPHYDSPIKQSNGVRRIETIGFLRQTFRNIIDVPSCIIATPAVNEKYQHVRNDLLNYPTTRNRGASLLFRQANLHDPVHKISTNHHEYITTTINNINFTYQAGNFFQNNYYVVPIMVDQVVHYASLPSSSSNNTKQMTHLIDCYCGSGLFALSAASKFRTVVGIEVNAKAVEEATQNAYNNHIENCHFRSASAEYIFVDIGHFPRETSVVVIDPPRKGCSPEFLNQLYEFAPQRIVYMSCDPVTQARDAQGILNTGKYRITVVQPFDLFPQTRHIECLIVFERI